MKKQFISILALVSTLTVLNSCKKEEVVTPEDPCKANFVTFTVDNTTRTAYFEEYQGTTSSVACDNVNTDANTFDIDVINPSDSSKTYTNLNKKQNTFNSLEITSSSYVNTRTTPIYGAKGSMRLNNKYYISSNTTDTTQYYNKITALKEVSVDGSTKQWYISGEFKMQMKNQSNSSDIKVVTGNYKYTLYTGRK